MNVMRKAFRNSLENIKEGIIVFGVIGTVFGCVLGALYITKTYITWVISLKMPMIVTLALILIFVFVSAFIIIFIKEIIYLMDE